MNCGMHWVARTERLRMESWTMSLYAASLYLGNPDCGNEAASVVTRLAVILEMLVLVAMRDHEHL